MSDLIMLGALIGGFFIIFLLIDWCQSQIDSEN